MAWGQMIDSSGPGAAFFGRAKQQAAPAPSKFAGLFGNLRSLWDPPKPAAQSGHGWSVVPDNSIEQRGDMERAYAQHGQGFFAPTASEGFNAQHGQAYLQPDANQQLWQQQQAAGPMANNALREYNAFRKPNIAAEPGYGSYYDNAQTNTVNALNTQLGARGAYGSSVGLGQIGKSITDLRADQARTEADYNLRRLGEQRSWNALGGELARSADLSAQGNQGVMSELARNASTSRLEGLNSAADAAANADRMRFAGLTGGMTAAGMAQNAREGRVGLGFDALFKNATGLSGLMGDAYNNLTGDDKALIDAVLGGKLGQYRESANQDSQRNLINQLGTILKGIETAKGT